MVLLGFFSPFFFVRGCFALIFDTDLPCSLARLELVMWPQLSIRPQLLHHTWLQTCFHGNLLLGNSKNACPLDLIRRSNFLVVLALASLGPHELHPHFEDSEGHFERS